VRRAKYIFQQSPQADHVISPTITDEGCGDVYTVQWSASRRVNFVTSRICQQFPRPARLPVSPWDSYWQRLEHHHMGRSWCRLTVTRPGELSSKVQGSTLTCEQYISRTRETEAPLPCAADRDPASGSQRQINVRPISATHHACLDAIAG